MEGYEIPDGAEIEMVDRPLNERLRPQVDGGNQDGLHEKLISKLKCWIQESKSHINQRSDDWEQVDEHMRLYLDLSRPARAGDKGYVYGEDGKTIKENPWDRMVCIPLTYSTILTRLVHMFGIFTKTDPFFHLRPSGGEDKRMARIHEIVMNRDAMLSKMPLTIWQTILDAEKYGFGIWYDTWADKHGWVTKPPTYNPAIRSSLPPQLQHLAEKSRSWERLYEWNRYQSVDPHCFLPDPGAPSILDPQAGTRCGHWEITNWINLSEKDLKRRNGPYFNLDLARKAGVASARGRKQAGKMSEGTSGERIEQMYPDLEVQHLQVKIIPKELGLSDVTYPEIWWFSTAEEDVIIRAHPSPYDHNEFTYSVGASDPDFSAPFMPGMGQQLIGGQNIVNWFFNSHMANIRKTVNDQVVYNDNLIEESDILSPGPARHIRLTSRGKQLHERGLLGIEQMYSQFRLTDVTQIHLTAAGEIIKQMQTMAATPDPVTGMPLPTKRTLGEIEQVSGSAIARIQASAELLDHQIIATAAARHIVNRQQWTSAEQVIRIAGRLAEELETEELIVRPEDLWGRYDYVAKTPSMASDPARSNALWGSLLQVLGSAPQLLEPDPLTGKQIDAHAVFNEFVRSAGVNYFEDFYREAPMLPQGGVDVMDDEQVQNGVDRGNLVPVGAGVPGAR
jgi:hypothetical protein